MEENLRQLWTYAHSIIGTCVLGFFALLRWIREVDKKCEQMDKEIERTVTLQKDIKEIFNSIKLIEDCMIGDYEKKGLLTDHKDLKKKVDKIDKRLEYHLEKK